MRISFIIILFLFSIIFQACEKERNIKNNIRNNFIPVFSDDIKGEDFNISIESVGKISSAKKSVLTFESSGQLEGIFYKTGDFIKKGTIIAQIESSNYEVAYELAKVSYEKASNDFISAQKLLDDYAISNDEFNLLNIALISAKSNYIQSKNRFVKCSLIAPFDGTIIHMDLNIGEYIIPGNKLSSSVVLADISELIVNVSVPESQIKDVFVGNEAIINVKSQEANHLKGLVSMVSLINDVGSNNYKVEISLNQNIQELKLGMIASVSIILEKFNNAIIIDKKIILNDKSGNYVFIHKNGIALKRYISIVHSREGSAMVEGELEIGDSLVTQGYRSVINGKGIKIIN